MIAMTARTTSHGSTEVLAVGTAVRYAYYRSKHDQGWRTGVIAGHIWRGDLFHRYTLDTGDEIGPSAIERPRRSR